MDGHICRLFSRETGVVTYTHIYILSSRMIRSRFDRFLHVRESIISSVYFCENCNRVKCLVARQDDDSGAGHGIFAHATNNLVPVRCALCGRDRPISLVGFAFATPLPPSTPGFRIGRNARGSSLISLTQWENGKGDSRYARLSFSRNESIGCDTLLPLLLLLLSLRPVAR